MESILSLTSIDGRYRSLTNKLENYFSEYGLFKYRVKVEIDYLIKLCDQLNIPINKEYLNSIKNNFNKDECMKIKQIESKINHDVKSVELYIGNKFNDIGESLKNLIHFGLTSQDINNVSISLSIKDYLVDLYSDNINKIIELINQKANEWKNIVIISRTHGQPAVPTTIGKEFKVFSYRLQRELENLQKLEIYSKFGGAVGNLNAHFLSYSDIDWENFANTFLNTMGLKEISLQRKLIIMKVYQ